MIDCKETVRAGVEGSPRAVLAVLEYILIPKYTNFYGKNAGGDAGVVEKRLPSRRKPDGRPR